MCVAYSVGQCRDLPDSFIEDALEVALGESRAFKVLLGLDLLCDRECLFV